MEFYSRIIDSPGSRTFILITCHFQLLLVGSASVMTSNVFTMVLRILSTVFRYCTSLTTEFIKQGSSVLCPDWLVCVTWCAHCALIG